MNDTHPCFERNNLINFGFIQLNNRTTNPHFLIAKLLLLLLVFSSFFLSLIHSFHIHILQSGKNKTDDFRIELKFRKLRHRRRRRWFFDKKTILKFKNCQKGTPNFDFRNESNLNHLRFQFANFTKFYSVDFFQAVRLNRRLPKWPLQSINRFGGRLDRTHFCSLHILFLIFLLFPAQSSLENSSFALNHWYIARSTTFELNTYGQWKQFTTFDYLDDFGTST